MLRLSDPRVFTPLLLLLIAGSYLAGSAAAHAVLSWDPDQSTWLLDRGPGKLMRRVTMMLVVIGLTGLLRCAQWNGWRDNGLWLVDETPPWRRDLATGFGLGVLTLGGLMLLGLLTGARILDPDHSPFVFLGVLLLLLLKSAVIAVVEETLARGILLRVLLRMWPLWAAALFVSGIFAGGHFLKPQDAAFGSPGLWAPIQSMFDYAAGIPMIGWRLLNMTLMSLVLCVVVIRNKTIWLAAGLHAGWVWTKGGGGKLLSFDGDAPYDWFMGRRSDFTDSALCSLTLLVLLMWAWRQPNRPVKTVGEPAGDGHPNAQSRRERGGSVPGARH